MYPFLDNESISYFPPHLSMLFPQGARSAATPYIYSAGILNITTKHPGKLKHTLSPEFHAVMPLGYQKPRQFYRAAYAVDGEADGHSGATVAWIPSADLSAETVAEIPSGRTASDMAITVEGVTTSGNTISLSK